MFIYLNTKEIVMKAMVLSAWNFMRWLRLLMGIYIIITSISGKNYVFALIGGLFVFQALTNTGCAACATAAVSKTDQNDTESIEFEEINAEKG
jgi:hypothetical protein